MDNDSMMIPYIVYESSMARAERNIKRLIAALIISIFMLVASNIVWLYVWNSYEYVGDSSEVTLESTDGGNANYIGNDGDITNGESNSEESN